MQFHPSYHHYGASPLPVDMGISSKSPQRHTAAALVQLRCHSSAILLELTPPKDVLFIIGDWNAKVESQEIPGVTG